MAGNVGDRVPGPLDLIPPNSLDSVEAKKAGEPQFDKEAVFEDHHTPAAGEEDISQECQDREHHRGIQHPNEQRGAHYLRRVRHPQTEEAPDEQNAWEYVAHDIPE
jgi:hypothetical protein